MGCGRVGATLARSLSGLGRTRRIVALALRSLVFLALVFALAEMQRVLQDVADKVGLLPNFRKQDNLFQLKWVAIGTALGAVVLQVWNPFSGAPFGVGLLLGAIGGMLVATIITGTILAIRNLKR